MIAQKRLLYTYLAGFFMLILILDPETAFLSASDGIMLCINTVIPSLFPFLIISSFLTGLLSGQDYPIFRPLGKLLHLPRGTAFIPFIGFLGGYPVGAQCIAQAHKNGTISYDQAKRMLAFCSNAGPAFLFGIGSRLFQQTWICFLLWLIHILSALMVGIMTTHDQDQIVHNVVLDHTSIGTVVQNAIRTMAVICSWVLVFRILTAFILKWVHHFLPSDVTVLISGLLELTNGCTSLFNISSPGMRYVLFSVMLAFGGICIAMQTSSVIFGSGLSIRTYLCGKITQAAISYLLCIITLPLLPSNMKFPPNPIVILVAVLVCIFYRKKQPKNEISYGKRFLSDI